MYFNFVIHFYNKIIKFQCFICLYFKHYILCFITHSQKCQTLEWYDKKKLKNTNDTLVIQVYSNSPVMVAQLNYNKLQSCISLAPWGYCNSLISGANLLHSFYFLLGSSVQLMMFSNRHSFGLKRFISHFFSSL